MEKGGGHGWFPKERLSKETASKLAGLPSAKLGEGAGFGEKDATGFWKSATGALSQVLRVERLLKRGESCYTILSHIAREYRPMSSSTTETTSPHGFSLEGEAYVEAIIERYRQYVNPGLARLMQFGGFGDVEVSAGGCVLTTATGAKYLDFLGGYGVFSVGHRHPKVVEAVHRQLDRLPLSARTFFCEAQALLAEQLARLTPGSLQF